MLLLAKSFIRQGAGSLRVDLFRRHLHRGGLGADPDGGVVEDRAAVWLGGLFNPQSFLTAIMQQTARKNEWPLDKMCLQCDVTKKYGKEEFSSAPREGSHVYGLFMEGARWDTGPHNKPQRGMRGRR